MNSPQNIQNRFGEAMRLHQAGRTSRAKDIYSEILREQPGHFDSCHLLGVLLIQTGSLREGVETILRALEIRPGNAEAHYNLAHGWRSLGDLARAAFCLEKAIALNPADPEYHLERANLLAELKRFDEALEGYDKAISLKHDYAEAYSNRGIALKELERFDDALASYDKAISLKPDYAEAYSNRGNVLREVRRLDEALASYHKAISLKPDYAEAYSNRGNALKDLRHFDDALVSHDKAISLKPDYAEAYNNRGNVLADLRRFDEALSNYERAISLRPDYAEAHRNCGHALVELNRFGDALASYGKAIRSRPDYAEAHVSCGKALADLRRFEDAVACYDKAVSLKPDIDYLFGSRLHLKMKLCDWSNFEVDLALLEDKIRRGGKSTSPGEAFGLHDDPELHLSAAKIYAADKYRASDKTDAIRRRSSGEKIRIGYYSADFHGHATSYLIAELLEKHDRNAFEFHGFSFGPRERDEMRERVSAAFDAFHEVNDKSDQDIAAMSRSVGIDIAVDLKGYTKDARAGIFSERCAPIQVNYLGHPGTMGAGYIDYVIADSVLIPESHRQFYAEKVVYLPDSYQANDSQRKISSRVFTRAELGLPDAAFVFCCFNNNYKIVPDVFDSWMRILQRVDGSVLWLFQDNESAAGNLRREAVKRGVSPDRLVFARRMPLDEHLARQRNADLFLDTFPYNAHTTASDALWAGLPVLTYKGKSFAARVAASLLTALDLRELIVDSLRDYEELAVSISQDPSRLLDMKQKLDRNRLTSSLFSGEAFARSIEAAYKEMLRRHDTGLPPDHIIISSI